MGNSNLWKIITHVNYNGKVFAIVKGKGRSLYFLEKVSENNYTYPTIEDFTYLTKKLNFTINELKSFSPSFNLKEQFVRIKTNGIEKIIPLALATSMILSIPGCNKKTINETTNDVTSSYETYIVEEPTTSETKAPNKTINFYKTYGVELEYCPEEDGTYFVKSQNKNKATDSSAHNYYNNILSIDFDRNISPAEMKEYLDVKNVTYDQILSLIDEQDFLDSDKVYLKKGLNNLKAKHFDIDLDILYYNLKNCKVVYWDSSMGQTNESFASFDCVKHEISLPKDHKLISGNYYFKILCHEVLGHALVTAYDDKTKTYCSLTRIGLTCDDNANILSASKVGTSFDEAFAELITTYSCDQLVSMYNSNYTVPTYELITILSLLDVSIEDFAKYGVTYLYDAAHEKGLHSVYDYIFTFDDYLNLQMSNLKFDDVNYDSYTENIFEENYDAFKSYLGSEFEVNKLYIDSLYAFENYMFPDTSPLGSYYYDENTAGSKISVNVDNVNKYIEQKYGLRNDKTL